MFDVKSVRQRQKSTLALLRALARPGVEVHWPCSDVLLVSCLPSAQGSRPRGGIRIEHDVVVAAISDGLLVETTQRPGGLKVTAAGFAWLRRQLASEDPFLSQHRELRREMVPGKSKRSGATASWVNDAESPLAWLRSRKGRDGAGLVDDKQFEAGERLRRDYTFAALGPRVTANWSSMAPSDRAQRSGPPAGAMRDDVIAAKARVARALEATGPELGRILFDVCCLLKGLQTTEAEQGLPSRSGKIVLQLALTALARHYGLLSPPTGSNVHRSILHWGDLDYRPKLDVTSVDGS